MIGVFILVVIGFIVIYFVVMLISKKGEVIKELEILNRVDNKIKLSFGKVMVVLIVVVILLGFNFIGKMLYMSFLFNF